MRVRCPHCGVERDWPIDAPLRGYCNKGRDPDGSSLTVQMVPIEAATGSILEVARRV